MKISDLDQPRVGDIVEFETDPETVVEGLIVGETDDGYIYEFSDSGYTVLSEAHGNSKVYDKCWPGHKKVPGKKRGEKGSCEKVGEGVAEGSSGLKKLHDVLWTVISEQTIDEETLNEIDPGLITNLFAVFPTISRIIVNNAFVKARKEAKETSLMIDVMKKHANNQPVTPEENEAMKTQFKDLVSYGVTAVAGVIAGVVAGPAAGVGVALAGAYKKELLTLLQTKGPEVLIGLLKSEGKLDVAGILITKFLDKHVSPFYAAPKMAEAAYHGREVPLGRPMQGDVKKFKVYVKDPGTGNVKKVNFGDPNMRIKKSNPARRRSFRARHNCKTPGPRTKARYWSCRKW